MVKQQEPAVRNIDSTLPAGKGVRKWIRRLGVLGFLFFLVKGLAWIIVPVLIAKGIFGA